MRARWSLPLGIPLVLMMVGSAGAAEPADFQLLTTGELLRVCDVSDDSPLYAEARQSCYGFIFGSGLFYYKAAQAGVIRKVVCPKRMVTREDVRLAFVDWARANPDKMEESPIDGLLQSAAAHWPCPENG